MLERDLLMSSGRYVPPCRYPSLIYRRAPAFISYRSGFFGKPPRTISCFRYQDGPSPPSPLVGEGGQGDKGVKAHRNGTFVITGCPQSFAGYAAVAQGGGDHGASAMMKMTNMLVFALVPWGRFMYSRHTSIVVSTFQVTAEGR
jgi:hypothetical protein